MDTVLVFPRATPALVRAHLAPGARVVAIDAGADALRACGVRPDRVVGDMDSVDAATLRALEAEGVPLVRHPSRKRDTDAALAVRDLPPDGGVLFLGPGGGRADHALANLHLLAALRGRARAVDADALTWIAAPERPLRLRRPVGATLSVIPFDGRCEGVSYEGLEYPLADATMEAGDPYGMSNVCAAPEQAIRVQSGRLVVIEPLQGP